MSVRNAPMQEQNRSEGQQSHSAALSWANVVGMFQMLPGLRGFWPMSASDSAGFALDLSGLQGHMQPVAGPAYYVLGLAPYINFNGSTQYLRLADSADNSIVGTETTIAAALRGLTVGGWFYPQRNTNHEYLVTKGAATAATLTFQLAYAGTVAGDPLTFGAHNGASSYTVTGTKTVVTGQWTFAAARFVPSTTLDLFTDDIKASNAVGIPAALNDVTGDLQIGARNGAGFFQGSAACVFLCAAALPDVVIRALYQHSRALFGR